METVGVAARLSGPVRVGAGSGQANARHRQENPLPPPSATYQTDISKDPVAFLMCCREINGTCGTRQELTFSPRRQRAIDGMTNSLLSEPLQQLARIRRRFTS